jgi:hypothetical protein
MIFGLDSLKAYIAMYKISGIKSAGIYMTSDGGTTWAHQPSASFNNDDSWPDVVHFFNSNDGACIGNPVNGVFEIYTTTNGGTEWALVPGGDIPSRLPHEISVMGCYSAVHDTIWFGTSMGRVYKSVDKGYHWTVSLAGVMAGKYVKPVFRNGSHGLLLDELSGEGMLCETFNGGVTWSQVDYTGSKYCGDISYVPGTTNTWVRSGFLTGPSGCAYSFDGGHTWTDFPGTTGSQFSQMAWVNDHCGWSGGINSSPTENGVQKYVGSLLSLPVGIANLEEQLQLKIYPNPAHGIVMVKTDSKNAVISIFDQSGKAMPATVKFQQSGFSTIDISRLTSGIYIVTLRTAEGISRTKLVVF